jgi:hypothetical protein
MLAFEWRQLCQASPSNLSALTRHLLYVSARERQIGNAASTSIHLPRHIYFQLHLYSFSQVLLVTAWSWRNEFGQHLLDASN